MMSIAWRWLMAIAIVAASGGCHTAHVRVLDVETGEPVSGASVVPCRESWFWPVGSVGDPAYTRRDGRATLRAPLLNTIYGFQVTADDYVPWRAPGNLIPTVDPGTQVGSDIVFYLYQAPGPVALLTIPNDYRGPMLISRPWEVEPPLSINQRVHEFILRDPGIPTEVPQSPPLHMIRTWRITVRYADGRSLPNADIIPPKQDGTQVFQLDAGRDPHVLFVGDAAGFRAFEQTVCHPSGRFWDFDSDALQRELEAAVQKWREGEELRSK